MPEMIMSNSNLIMSDAKLFVSTSNLIACEAKLIVYKANTVISELNLTMCATKIIVSRPQIIKIQLQKFVIAICRIVTSNRRNPVWHGWARF